MTMEITEKMRLAFYEATEATKEGTVLNLDAGLRAALSAAPVSAEPSEWLHETLTPDEAWELLCNSDDRTSPEEYLDHALITKEELASYMERAACTTNSSDPLKQALMPFVSAFNEAQEKYVARYYGNADTGLENFNKMPDSWAMDGITFSMGDYRRARAALADQKGGAVALPSDVTNLVIAAREFWEMHNDLSGEASALDKALEAFSSLVPYENQPEEDA